MTAGTEARGDHMVTTRGVGDESPFCDRLAKFLQTQRLKMVDQAGIEPATS